MCFKITKNISCQSHVVRAIILYEEDQQLYVAKAEEIDQDDNDLHISFMISYFSFNSIAQVIRWPAGPDVL